MTNPECEALSEVGARCPLKPSCGGASPPTPSYFERAGEATQGGAGSELRPRGCWVAHTMLTILEALCLFNSVEPALLRKGLSAEVVVSAALMHDVGKLASSYLRRRERFHNIASAIFTYRLMSSHAKLRGYAGPAAQAVLLHHEHRMWEHLSSSEDYVIRDYYSVLRRFSYAELDEKGAVALETLRAVLEDYSPAAPGVQSAHELISKLLASRKAAITPHEQQELLRPAHARLSLPLYYLLQLADNRAAWRRDRVNWRASIGELSNQAREPASLAQLILLRQGAKSRLLLTLPRC